MAKKVRIVPIVGANEPTEVEMHENMSIGEAIAEAFPAVQGKDIVIEGEDSRAMSSSTQPRNGELIRFMPLTTGG